MIEFNAEKHEYLVDGIAVPSVTQIVAPLGEDYDDLDELTELAVDAAAERGTTLHAYLEWRMGGGSREDFELPDSYQAYADGCDLFLQEHLVIPLAAEEPLGCETYAGTPDLLCEMDGVLTLLDYKFVSQVAKSKVGAQLGGYAALLARDGVFPEKLAAVQFLPGSYRIYPVFGPKATEAFDLCWRIYTMKNQKHPRGRIFA